MNGNHDGAIAASKSNNINTTYAPKHAALVQTIGLCNIYINRVLYRITACKLFRKPSSRENMKILS